MNISFFRKGRFNFFEYEDNLYEVNPINIKMLKERLAFPFEFKFTGYKRADLGQVISYFIDSSVSVTILKKMDKNLLVPHCIAWFNEIEKTNEHTFQKKLER